MITDSLNDDQLSDGLENRDGMLTQSSDTGLRTLFVNLARVSNADVSELIYILHHQCLNAQIK